MTVADEWEQMCGGSWEDEHAAKAAPAPAPSPAEQAVIDRFGIFDEDVCGVRKPGGHTTCIEEKDHNGSHGDGSVIRWLTR